MTFFWLNLITGSRLVLCAPIWLWCWWRRPRGMVAWMALDFLYFFFTDHFDGQWAREYHLVSELGFWLDHLGDLFFYGAIVLTILKGSREPAGKREDAWRGRRARSGPAEPPPPPTPPTPPTTDPTPGATPPG